MREISRNNMLMVFLCLSGFFLSSCSSVSMKSVDTKLLEELIERQLVLLPDGGFEAQIPGLKDKEIVFLGETHKIPELKETARDIVLELSGKKSAVFAIESTYGMHPFLETASVTGQQTAIPVTFSDKFRVFNDSRPNDKKILVTALDVEHSVYHTKNNTVLFLQNLAFRSNSTDAYTVINEEILKLPGQNTYHKMDRYLKKLRQIFLNHFDTFSADDQEEIEFSMELIIASNTYQYASWGKIIIFQNPYNTRRRYFIKTIERAYEKAKLRDSVFVCRVGAHHAQLNENVEARYFAENYPKTKGKVASLRLLPLSADKAHKEDMIDDIVMNLMGHYRYAYLSLKDLQSAAEFSLLKSNYYNRNGRRYDGILFVKVD
jgi:hypothetical protein